MAERRRVARRFNATESLKHQLGPMRLQSWNRTSLGFRHREDRVQVFSSQFVATCVLLRLQHTL
jgi:hypothetical protein